MEDIEALQKKRMEYMRSATHSRYTIQELKEIDKEYEAFMKRMRKTLQSKEKVEEIKLLLDKVRGMKIIHFAKG